MAIVGGVKLSLPIESQSFVSSQYELASSDLSTKKYDLEGWFHASSTYRELVSCSNCTDYQSRKLKTQFGHKGEEKVKQYVHLLNSTLTATERTMCCILENYQREYRVEIPEVLRPSMGGTTFIPFQAAPA
ncbi:Serine--tRNA ligase [Capsicum baccatum]|uniref:Serine--tRNA ligase n=1 Tax=Capsicum baccatum TaxID=33114 RepID=A0A2G2V9Q9_CAPBA|nr:Serine--tRNA ligase [Capsicum baccatum]